MKIAFCDNGPLDYTPDTPFGRALGGTESAAAYLSAAMAARGHEVALVNRSSRSGVVRGVTMTGIDGARPKFLNHYDVAICLTRPLGLSFRQAGVTSPLVCWQHMNTEMPFTRAFGQPAERDAWDAFVFVSDDQRTEFATKFGIEGITFRNAASPAALCVPISSKTFLERNDDPILIYSSAPGRGLDLLLAGFAAARERLPGLRLMICSDEGIYQRDANIDRYSVFYAPARALPGIEFVGSVSQTQLAQSLSQADIFAYPTDFRETSCIAAIEAAASGCFVVASDYGALRETMAGFGSFISLVDSRAAVAKAFADLVCSVTVEARADPDLYAQKRENQIAHFRTTHTWEARAEEWERWLMGLVAQRH